MGCHGPSPDKACAGIDTYPALSTKAAYGASPCPYQSHGCPYESRLGSGRGRYQLRRCTGLNALHVMGPDHIHVQAQSNPVDCPNWARTGQAWFARSNLAWAPVGLAIWSNVPAGELGQTDRHTNFGQTDVTKYIISLASRSIISNV